jgi:DNA-binding NarL/FixJ family response regulator
MKVLLVDDSPQVIECLKEMLVPLEGIDLIGHAGDIPEALSMIREAKPDVVLLDLNLPSGSGIEVLGTIKKEMPAVSIMVLTNYAFPQYKKRCLNLGAYAFLDKSTDFMKIPQLIRTLTDTAPQQQQYPSQAGPERESNTKVVSR